jgi:hypothetical protein
MAGFPASEAERRWHVTIRHGPGSPEHFHHFLLGFFVPLVYHLSTNWRHARFDRVVVRSCGPLDRVIREFGDDRIEIIDRDLHCEIAQAGADSRELSVETVANPEQLRFVTIHGCDYPATYDAVKFCKVRDVLRSMEATHSATRSLAERWPTNGDRRILLIQRGGSLPYYHSERAEFKDSGQDRRSIANHEELYRSLRLEYPGCLSVMTETLTLADQVALFSLADVIIAQHGAALANLIWARPNATVIEIFPDTARLKQKAHRLFYFLSLCIGLRYRKVGQRHEHSAVDIDEIRKVIAKVIRSPSSRLATAVRSGAFRMVRPALPINQMLQYQFLRACDRAARVRRRFVGSNHAGAPR